MDYPPRANARQLARCDSGRVPLPYDNSKSGAAADFIPQIVFLSQTLDSNLPQEQQLHGQISSE